MQKTVYVFDFGMGQTVEVSSFSEASYIARDRGIDWELLTLDEAAKRKNWPQDQVKH